MNTEELAKARELLAAAIEEKGADYMYPETEKRGEDCQYLTYTDITGEMPSGPSCLVGHVLVGMGVPMAQIMNMEGWGALRATRAAFVDSDVRMALDCAQQDQDQGATWGKAVEAFERYVSARDQELAE